jgi:hypothetical protein
MEPRIEIAGLDLDPAVIDALSRLLATIAAMRTRPRNRAPPPSSRLLSSKRATRRRRRLNLSRAISPLKCSRGVCPPPT